MTFAINLKIIRVNQVDDIIYHHLGGIGTDIRAIAARMKIKVDAEETVRPLEARRFIGRGSYGSNRQGQGKDADDS